jgi:hypothetical protein
MFDDQTILANPWRESSEGRTRAKTMQPISADDVKSYRADFEEAPRSMLLMPYWQLRCVYKSLWYGAFLHADLFLPRQAWEQDGVRFSGINVKIAAFKEFCAIVDERVAPLVSLPSNSKARALLARFAVEVHRSLPSASVANPAGQGESSLPAASNSPRHPDGDQTSAEGGRQEYICISDEEAPLEVIHSMYVGLVGANSELCGLQNQLAKSFPFISEAIDHFGNGSQRGRGTSTLVGSPIKTGSGGDDSDRRYSSSGNSKDVAIEEEGNASNSKVTESGGGGFFSRGLGVLGRAGSMMSSAASSLGKNVRWIGEASMSRIEVGISRIGAAIPSKASQEELLQYGEAARAVAERCQLFQQLHCYLEHLRAHLLSNSNSKSNGSGGEVAAAAAAASTRDHTVSMVEATMMTLLHITCRVKDSICGLVLRDAQEIHAAYMLSMQEKMAFDD